jgi:sialate O-acetylesterase
MSPLPPQTFVRWKPVGLFNAMIAPLQNYPVKGVLWYQGESSTAKPFEYKALLTTLIEDWRSLLKQPDLPFMIVQLANFMEVADLPQESNWAEVRQQQKDLLEIPFTGLAVTIDLGEWNDIHPLNKQDVGLRLALQARQKVYGEKKLVASGPLFSSMEKRENKLILKFTNVGSGLVSKNSDILQGFAISGADGKFVWANAAIEGDTVVVWHDTVKDPSEVRYAWANNPEGASLYNKENLPASPFKSKF